MGLNINCTNVPGHLSILDIWTSYYLFCSLKFLIYALLSEQLDIDDLFTIFLSLDRTLLISLLVPSPDVAVTMSVLVSVKGWMANAVEPLTALAAPGLCIIIPVNLQGLKIPENLNYPTKLK